MSIDDLEKLAQLANLAMAPIAGLLWKISTQLATLVARVDSHTDRLDRIEDRCTPCNVTKKD